MDTSYDPINNVTNSLDQFTSDQEKQLKLSDHSYDFLIEISKWTKFLSIIGFVCFGFIMLTALVMLANPLFSSDTSGNFLIGMGMGIVGGGFYLIIGVIYLIPSKYLFDFSKQLRKAVETTNNMTLEDAFKNLKSFFKFSGITMIIVLSFYVLILLGAIVIVGLGLSQEFFLAV